MFGNYKYGSRMRKINSAIIMVLLMATASGCAKNANKLASLTGERVPVLEGDVNGEQMFSKDPFGLPAAAQNTSWPAQGDVCNFTVGDQLKKVQNLDVQLLRLKYNDAPIAIDGNIIYLFNSNGSIEALDAKGDQVWKTEYEKAKGFLEESKFIGNISVYQKTLFATYGTSQIKAFNIEDGSLQWSVKLTSTARSKPYVYKNIVLVQTVDNKLMALDSETGKVRWSHYGVPNDANIVNSITPIVKDDKVFVNYSSREIFALNINNGSEVWSYKIKQDLFSKKSLSDFTNADPQIFIDHTIGALIATSSHGDLVALKIKDGELIFNKKLGINNAAIGCGSYVYYTSNPNVLSAVSKKTGDNVWIVNLLEASQYKDEPKLYWSAPVLIDSQVFIHNSFGEGMFFSAQTGAYISTIDVISDSTAQPIVANNKLYLMNNDGGIGVYAQK